MGVRIQQQPFNIGEETEALRHRFANTGAIVTFVGQMREIQDSQPLQSLYLEHYSGMAEKQISDIIVAAKQRWPVWGIEVIHRCGVILPKEEIVFVGVCSEHRIDAFRACEFVMDFLKTEAPFWKREQSEGATRWLEANPDDEQQKHKWQEPE